MLCSLFSILLIGSYPYKKGVTGKVCLYFPCHPFCIMHFHSLREKREIPRPRVFPTYTAPSQTILPSRVLPLSLCTVICASSIHPYLHRSLTNNTTLGKATTQPPFNKSGKACAYESTVSTVSSLLDTVVISVFLLSPITIKRRVRSTQPFFFISL